MTGSTSVQLASGDSDGYGNGGDSGMQTLCDEDVSGDSDDSGMQTEPTTPAAAAEHAAITEALAYLRQAGVDEETVRFLRRQEYFSRLAIERSCNFT